MKWSVVTEHRKRCTIKRRSRVEF